MSVWQPYITNLPGGDTRAVARCISLVENESEGYLNELAKLHINQTPVIGITGAPGAGKSSLTDALIAEYVNAQKRIAVLCVDPSSPFNFGAVLGDRIRMSRWYNSDFVYIRSLATRGSLGGLNNLIIEITDVLRAANFDAIIIETVGVGQSEIDIAGLADVTVVVLVPEGGDEIQTMKAGIMEIADIFVINKADRPGAATFEKNLRLMLAPAFSRQTQEIEVVKTIATKQEGISVLYGAIAKILSAKNKNSRRNLLMATKAYQLIQQQKMKGVNLAQLQQALEQATAQHKNIYRFVQEWIGAED